MKYMLLIHQGTTPTPLDPAAWATLSDDEKQARAWLPPGQDAAHSFRYNNFLHVQANLTPANIATVGLAKREYW